MMTRPVRNRRVYVDSVRNCRQNPRTISASWKKCAALLFSTGLITLAAWAQSQPPAPPPAQTSRPQSTTAQDAQASRPSLKVVSQMVQVDVIAKDRNGNPVKDLKQSDFTVYDNGKKQEIAWFSLETDKTINKPAAPVAPNTYSNLVEQKAGVPGNLTIILLDFLNTKHSDMVAARNQVMKMLQQMKPEDRVAIYVLSGRLYVLHDFTSDSSALTRSVRNYDTTDSADRIASNLTPAFSGSGGNNNGAAGADLGGDNFLNQAYQNMSDFANIDRMYTTTQVFEIISQHMVRVPGRKNLIWVSGSFPFSINLDYDREGSPYSAAFGGPGALSVVPVGGAFGTVANVNLGSGSALGMGAAASGPGGPLISDPAQFGEEIQRAIREMTNANIAMYPVDTHGLVAPGDVSTDPSSITGTSIESMPMIGGDPSTTPGSMLSTNFDTMQNLAQHTGGLVFASTNDIGGSVHKAMDDGRVSYMIAYYPTQDNGKEKFHNIKLKVNRPDVSIRYRNGYYAEPLNYDGVSKTAPIIRQALTSPLDATGLGMTVHARAITANGARTLGLTLDVEQGDITFRYDDGHTMGTVKVVLAQFDTEGNEIAGETTTVKMQLDKDTYGTVRKDGLRFRRNLPLKPEAVELKIVACDDKSSAVGSVSIPLAKYFPPAGK